MTKHGRRGEGVHQVLVTRVSHEPNRTEQLGAYGKLRRQRVRFESFDNGFLRCADAAALQATNGPLGQADVQAFFRRPSQPLP